MAELKRTPLYETHIKYKGKMIDFGGWELPVQYSSILAEHKAVREQAGLFDVSHMGEIDLTGADAYKFLQHVLTNDVTTMTPGRCRYSPVCYPDGGTVDDILVSKFDDEHYLLIVNASNTDKDYEWFLKNAEGFDVKLENQSPAWAQLALQGPRAMEILANAKAVGIPEKYYTFIKDSSISGIPCIIARTGYTGEDGVEVYCATADASKMYETLMDAGKELGLVPCGLGARDTLRFEASMPLYGHEITKDITPVECGLSFAIKLDKAEFIGREALCAPKTRARIGLKLVDRGIAREHSDVYLGDKLVGFTTSGGVAPTLGGNYAMALVDIEAAEQKELFIDVRGKKLLAEIVPMPFYKRAK